MGDVLSFVESLLDEAGCGRKEKKQISMAVEEIFVNITSYAYPPEATDGKIKIRMETHQQSVAVTISDTGVPYNPLDRPDPDLAMGVEDRQHGGFGIFLVKNAMDDLTYVRQGNQNVMTVRKSWGN